MAESLLGGILGEEDEKPEAESPEALARAEAFAAAIVAKLADSDPEVARDMSAFLKERRRGAVGSLRYGSQPDLGRCSFGGVCRPTGEHLRSAARQSLRALASAPNGGRDRPPLQFDCSIINWRRTPVLDLRNARAHSRTPARVCNRARCNRSLKPQPFKGAT
jgi:hypothetical protein